jgi:hypothetical protein
MLGRSYLDLVDAIDHNRKNYRIPSRNYVATVVFIGNLAMALRKYRFYIEI